MISFSEILHSIWPVFEIEVPGLGMSFKDMFFGMLAVSISVGIIKSLLPDATRRADQPIKRRGKTVINNNGDVYYTKNISAERRNDEK